MYNLIFAVIYQFLMCMTVQKFDSYGYYCNCYKTLYIIIGVHAY